MAITAITLLLSDGTMITTSEFYVSCITKLNGIHGERTAACHVTKKIYNDEMLAGLLKILEKIEK
jgi:hypothetical protein